MRGLVGALALALVLVCAAALLVVFVPKSGAWGGSETTTSTRADAENLTSAIIANPGQVDLYLHLADLYMSPKACDLQAAVALLREAIAVDATSSSAYLKLATVELLLGHKKTAAAALERYQRLTGNKN